MKKLYFTFTLLSLISICFSQNALRFDGTNDHVVCGNNASIQITGTAITLEAWIYPTSFKSLIWQGNIINKETNHAGYMLRAGGINQLNFNIGNGTTWNELTSPPNTLTLNTWQHVAATYDGSYLKIYVNGTIIDSLARTISISNSSSSLFIGEAGFYTGRHFPGKIDELRIWNVARTKKEIIENMNNELCVYPSSLKAYYTFNQGIASGNNSSTNTLTDLSGNNNTGTLNSFSLNGNNSNWVTGQNLVPGIISNTNYISACGSYTMPNGTIVTTAGTYFDTLSTTGNCDTLDSYIITFPPAIILNTISDTGCMQYTTQLGKLITSSGTYYDTISGAIGCDTTIEYNIVISGAVDDSVYRNGGRITSWDTWADHQWIRCDNNYAPIIGATNKYYDATQAGDYAVIVKRGNCIDTSDCVSISITSIEKEFSQKLEIFPNPTSDLIKIKGEYQQATYRIISTNGQVVKSASLSNSRIDVSELENGLYFIEISFGKQTIFSKFIKQ